MNPAPRPLPAATDNTSPGPSTNCCVPAQTGHLPAPVLHPGPEESRVPERGNYCPAAAPAVRGGRGKTARWATPEINDVRRGVGGGRGPGQGVRPGQSWEACLKDDIEAFGATYGSTDAGRVALESRNSWTEAVKVAGETWWHTGVVKGPGRFITPWHKDKEEASQARQQHQE